MKSNLKKIRESRGLTQAELANKTGVNLRLIQHYEQMTKNINKAAVDTVIKLAQGLNCKVAEILNSN